MRIIAVDDERPALEGLVDSIRSVAPDADVRGFRYAEDALAFAQESAPDVAFLDVEMPETNGVGLAQKLKEIQPDVNIVFATGYGSYRDAAFDLHASGYVVKPITPQKVAKELADLRRPPVGGKRLRVRAFGNFEAYCDGKPIGFHYNKAKELLAYLVDRRGALCTVGEMMAVLFEEEGKETYFKSIRSDLLKTMDSLGCGSAIARQHGKLGVVPEAFDCDYFDFLEGKESGKRNWRGEYMAQYSWAEETCASLGARTETRE